MNEIDMIVSEAYVYFSITTYEPQTQADFRQYLGKKNRKISIN